MIAARRRVGHTLAIALHEWSANIGIVPLTVRGVSHWRIVFGTMRGMKHAKPFNVKQVVGLDRIDIYIR